MPGENEWPTGGIIMRLEVDITNNVLSIVSPSALINPGIAGWNPTGLTGVILVNGTQQATLSFNKTTRAVTASSTVSVTTGDDVEVRWQKLSGSGVEPWDSEVLTRRSAFFTVPAGNTTFTFDRSTNEQPVPDWALAFGWDASSSNTFKATFEVDNANGATQQMVVGTRRINPTSDSSTSNIDLSSVSAQSHDADFTKSDVGAGKFVMDMTLKSDSGSTYMQDYVRITFNDADDVPTYSTDTLLKCINVQDGIYLAQPW